MFYSGDRDENTALFWVVMLSIAMGLYFRGCAI